MSETYHHGNLREVVLVEAEKRLEKLGAESLSLREIARDAGVSPGAPYRHFASRDALLDELANRGFSDLADRLARAGLLEERLSAYFRFAQERPEMLRLMFRRVPADVDCEVFSESASRAFALLVEAVQPLLPRDVSFRNRAAAAVGAWALIHGYSVLFSEGVLRSFLGESLPKPAELGLILCSGLPGLVQGA